MSTWRRHRAQRNSRASSIAPPGGGGLDDPRSPGNTALGAVRKCGSGRSLGRDRQVSTVRGCVCLLADSDLTPTHERRHRRYARRAPPLAGSIGSGGKQRHVPQAGAVGRFSAGSLRPAQSVHEGCSPNNRAFSQPPTRRGGRARVGHRPGAQRECNGTGAHDRPSAVGGTAPSARGGCGASSAAVSCRFRRFECRPGRQRRAARLESTVKKLRNHTKSDWGWAENRAGRPRLGGRSWAGLRPRASSAARCAGSSPRLRLLNRRQALLAALQLRGQPVSARPAGRCHPKWRQGASPGGARTPEPSEHAMKNTAGGGGGACSRSRQRRRG